jgi:hypothetical protein
MSAPNFRAYMASLIFSKQRNILDINFLVKDSLHWAVQQMYPIWCSTADSTFQDAGHVTATRRPAPLADKLVKYSQLCSPGDCVTTCYGSRDPTLLHTSIQQYKSNSVVQRKSNAEIEKKMEYLKLNFVHKIKCYEQNANLSLCTPREAYRGTGCVVQRWTEVSG